MEKIIYKKVTIAIENGDDSVSIQCIRLKGDEKLEMGEKVTVRGELKRRDSKLEFGNGCEYVKATDAPAADASVISALRDLPEGEVFANGFCAMTGVVTGIVKVPNDKPQKITYLIGALAMFFAAVFYMVMTDLTFNNTASKLIVSVLLSFGSAILFFLSSSFSEKPVIMFLLKGIGVALAVGFILYVHLFQAYDPYYLGKIDEFEKAGAAGTGSLVKTQVTMIITLVCSYIAFVAQAANTALVAIFKEEE